jgi:hypothetical protein
MGYFVAAETVIIAVIGYWAISQWESRSKRAREVSEQSLAAQLEANQLLRDLVSAVRDRFAIN